MLVKFITDEDIVNYKKTCMVIGFPTCNGFKCGKELCQNSPIAEMKNIEVDNLKTVRRYLNNPLTSAISMMGLEPCDSPQDLFDIIKDFRDYTQDDIVIYTGYTEDEIPEIIKELQKFKNIIVKFGRYVPNQTPHLDKILGVKLASDNQYAKKIS